MKNLFELILSIKRKCQANEDRIQQEMGISQAEFNGLLVLNPDESVPGAEFAQRMGLSPSRGSRVLTKLMKSGYVNSEFKPDDRRSVSIRLTQNGIKMKNQIYNRMQACETRICSGIDHCKIDQIREALVLLEQAL